VSLSSVQRWSKQDSQPNLEPCYSKMCGVTIESGLSSRLVKFIVERNDLASEHQNQAATDGFHSIPESWISWASKNDDRWREVMKIYSLNREKACFELL